MFAAPTLKGMKEAVVSGSERKRRRSRPTVRPSLSLLPELQLISEASGDLTDSPHDLEPHPLLLKYGADRSRPSQLQTVCTSVITPTSVVYHFYDCFITSSMAMICDKRGKE